jgi:hypothetical protein
MAELPIDDAKRVAGEFASPTVSAYCTGAQESSGMGGNHSSFPPSSASAIQGS